MTYWFTFVCDEVAEATVDIRGGTVRVREGKVGEPDLQVRADARTWLGFLAGEKNIVWALVRRKVRLRGPVKLLVAFGKCFGM